MQKEEIYKYVECTNKLISSTPVTLSNIVLQSSMLQFSWKLLHPTDRKQNPECPETAEEYERVIKTSPYHHIYMPSPKFSLTFKNSPIKLAVAHGALG